MGALRSLASTLMQPVGQPFGQAPSPLRAVGLLLDSGLLQRHYLYLSRASTRPHCVLALPAWPAPPPAGDPVPLIVRSRRGFFLPV